MDSNDICIQYIINQHILTFNLQNCLYFFFYIIFSKNSEKDLKSSNLQKEDENFTFSMNDDYNEFSNP